MEHNPVIREMMDAIESAIDTELNMNVSKLEFACFVDQVIALTDDGEPYLLTDHEPYVRLFMAYEILKHGNEKHEPTRLTL